MTHTYSLLDRYGKAAGVMLGGVLVVAAMYFGLIYMITMK
jgi:hypothetical protein